MASVAARLRVLHTDLADQPSEMRLEQIRDEVQRALATQQPGEREGFLRELIEQFPLWTDAMAEAPAAAPAPARNAAAPAPETKDPRVLAAKLAEISKGLNPIERSEIAVLLAGAGIVQEKHIVVGGGGGDLPAAQLAEFRKAVGLPNDARVDPVRLVELCAVFTEMALKLEPWAVQYWRDIAPEAKNNVYQVLNKEVQKFVGGSEEASKESLAKNAFRLRSLLLLVMKGISEVGRQFARDHLSRFSVDEIIKASGQGSLLESKDVKCWKQYQKLMEGMDAASVEKRLKGLLAKDVDAGLSQVIK